MQSRLLQKGAGNDTPLTRYGFILSLPKTLLTTAANYGSSPPIIPNYFVRNSSSRLGYRKFSGHMVFWWLAAFEVSTLICQGKTTVG